MPMGGSRRLSSTASPSQQAGRKTSVGSTAGTFGGSSSTSPSKVARHESFEQKDDYQDEAEVT